MVVRPTYADLIPNPPPRAAHLPEGRGPILLWGDSVRESVVEEGRPGALTLALLAPVAQGRLVCTRYEDFADLALKKSVATTRGRPMELRSADAFAGSPSGVDRIVATSRAVDSRAVPVAPRPGAG